MSSLELLLGGGREVGVRRDDRLHVLRVKRALQLVVAVLVERCKGDGCTCKGEASE